MLLSEKPILNFSEKHFQTKYLNIKNPSKYTKVMGPQEITFYEDLGNIGKKIKIKDFDISIQY